jgi:hypothetical protein
MGNTRGSFSKYKAPKKSFGSKLKTGLKKAAGNLSKSLLGSASPENVQKPSKTGNGTSNNGLKEGLKSAAKKVAKGWHKG